MIMKVRILFAILMVAVLLTGLVAPVAGQGGGAADTAGQGPSLEEQLKLGLISDKEYDALAVQGAGCGPDAAWPGPDGYGYVGATIGFNWVDITATGTLVTGWTSKDDGYAGPFPIGFTFNFYGTDWADFYTGSNGFLSFGAGSTSLSNQCPLPSSSTPDNIIALLWDDLNLNTSGDAYYQTFGTCPVGDAVQCLVVEYYNAAHYGGSAGSAGTWEAILYDNGKIALQFLDSGVELGSSSTTGIENANYAGDYGLTYACNLANSIPDELAILFAVPVGPILNESTKEAPAKAVLGEEIGYTVTILNTGSGPAEAATMVDPIPTGTTYVDGSVNCSSGQCWYDSGVVYWEGQVATPPGRSNYAAGKPAGQAPEAGLVTAAQAEAKAVPAAPNPEDVLWDQYANWSGTDFASQDFESAYDAYDIYAGDDFENAEAWSIDTIVTRGGFGGYVNLANASAIHWFIYADYPGKPAGFPGDGSEFWSISLAPSDPQVGLGVFEPEDVVLTLDTPVELPAGHWWLVYFASLEFGLYGQYGWSGTSDPVNGYIGMQANPNGGFGMGSDWWANTYGQDYMFRLEGTVGAQPPENPVVVQFSVDTDGLECGATVVNEATLNDPQLPGPVVVSASTEVWLAVWLHEDFEGDTFPPPGWVEAHDPAGMAWTDQDLEPRGNLTGGTGKFAIVDDDYGGSGALTVAQLWTPPFDIPLGYSTFLVYKTDYNSISTDESADVDISLDGGGTWINLQHWNTDMRGPLTVQIDLSPFAGATGAILRFYYNDGGHYAWWWEVDDVQLVSCEEPTEPDIDVTPAQLDQELCPDAQAVQQLNVCNLGDAELTWELAEIVAPKGPLAVLYDNGPLVTHPGGGYGGADASALQTALLMNTYGFGHQLSYNYRVADQFEITDPAGWNIQQITFFAYQTNSPTDPSPMNHVNYAIWDGMPPNGTIVFGDYATNRLVSTAWMGAYRVADYDMMGNTRPIMADVASAGVVLPPGTYWLDWQTGGTLSSGPWAPPITILGETTTGDALQSLDGGVSYAGIVDSGTGTPQGLPFVIEGEIAGPPPDIPWLSEDPLAGTVAPGDCQVVDVTFDSTGLEPGDYFGTLRISSNDPDEPEVDVPVTLTVLPCGENTIHVGDITGVFYADPYGRPVLRIRVPVADQNSTPMVGVEVVATITYPGGEATRTRHTGPQGNARYHWGSNVHGDWSLCVDNLALDGYVYDPDQNFETCEYWSN